MSKQPLGTETGEYLVSRMLEVCCHEDPTREGLQETPARVAKAWRFWTKGYTEDPAALLKVFEDGAALVEVRQRAGASNVFEDGVLGHHVALTALVEVGEAEVFEDGLGEKSHRVKIPIDMSI